MSPMGRDEHRNSIYRLAPLPFGEKTSPGKRGEKEGVYAARSESWRIRSHDRTAWHDQFGVASKEDTNFLRA